MRSYRNLIFAAATCVAPLISGHGAMLVHAQDARAAFVPDEVIVKYRPGTPEHGKARVRGRIKAVAQRALSKRPSAEIDGAAELVRLPRGSGVQRAIAALQNAAEVEYAEPNWIYRPAALPNDPHVAQQWALENSGQSVAGEPGGTADADIDAADAWYFAPDATSVYVGVIDQGVDITHEDLGVQPGGAIWRNPYDPVDGRDNDGNGYVDDVHGWDFFSGDNTVYDGSALMPHVDAHGTHVTGTIGARWGNGVGIAGVSPGVVIIPAKFLGPDGGSTADAIRAVEYFTDLKRRHNLNIVAINNSWTGGGYSQALLDAIGRAAAQRILFIASAGNGGSDSVGDDNDALPSYPAGYDTSAIAGYDSVISVTATDTSDALPRWANYGARSVDLAAPGALVLSTSPQGGYQFMSGTSMAAPHVTGAAALVAAARGLDGAALKSALLQSVDARSALTGRAATHGRLNLARAVAPAAGAPAPPASGAADIVLLAAHAQTVAGNWFVQSDSTAAGGWRMQSANLGAPKVAVALPAPDDYFELTFTAQAGTAYRLWIRGKPDGNAWANDSVHVQFSGAVTSAGVPIYRIGSTSSAEVNIEDCSGCGLSGWGWQDNGYGGVLGPLVQFSTSGPQRLRVQIREDGIGIDQIVLSPGKYLSSSPGALKNDGTTLADGGGGTSDLVLYAADASVVAGRWTRTADASAAGGSRLQNANAGAAKIATALAAPADYFELTFTAAAGTPYRLWIRGKAEGNHWGNDSVHVQFSDSVSASGTAAHRIGTSASAEVNLEDCSSCGVAGWGWQDNGYGAGALGPEIRFANSGVHTMRIQVREDGFGIDQIVLSAAAWRTAAPGSPKNDSTILPRSSN